MALMKNVDFLKPCVNLISHVFIPVVSMSNGLVVR